MGYSARLAIENSFQRRFPSPPAKVGMGGKTGSPKKLGSTG